MNNRKEIAVFKTDDESINVEVFFEDDTAWLT
ncbi:MAG: cell filamentation protein Fic, partial [Fibrobacteraceae bacterium]|nr:cell filamentation protein Fic [Fibrobacteraceae bacterium]